MADSGKISTLEDLLANAMGRCGFYQVMVIFLIFLHRAPVGFHLLSVAVLTPRAIFNCSDPQFDKCDKDCPSHEFDKSIWESTVVTEFDLVCNKHVITSIIQGITMLGILVGSFIFGWAGDQFGRLYPLAVAVTIQLITGVGVSFTRDLYSFIILRFLSTLSTGGSMIPSFALFLEFTDPKYRTTLGVLYMIPVHFAHALLGVVAYYCRSWTCIQFSVSLYSVVLLTYWFAIPESPRWLSTRHKTERLVRILERGAKCNRRPTDNIRGNTEAYINATPMGKPGGMKDLFVTYRMRVKTVISMFNWLVIAMEFYAIAQYIGLIGGDIFFNIIFAGLIQVPGNLMGCVLISLIGRKWTIIASYMLISVPMIAVFVIMIKWQELTLTIAVLSSLSQMGAAMGFALIYVYTGELLPTVVRSAGIGICSMFGRVGSIISPFLMLLEDIGKWCPPLVFAVIPIFTAAATMIWLPETKGTELPDTIEEADKI